MTDIYTIAWVSDIAACQQVLQKLRTESWNIRDPYGPIIRESVCRCDALVADAVTLGRTAPLTDVMALSKLVEDAQVRWKFE